MNINHELKTYICSLKYSTLDLFDKISKSMGGPLGQHQKWSHGYFSYPKLEGEIGPHMMFNGKEHLVWSLNNYLGLANHPEVREPTHRRPPIMVWLTQWVPA